MMSLFLYRFPFTLLSLFRCRFLFRFRFLFPFPFLFRIPISGFSRRNFWTNRKAKNDVPLDQFNKSLYILHPNRRYFKGGLFICFVVHMKGPSNQLRLENN